MSHNVHGHKQPEPFKTNPDNPIFQRHQPEYEQPEVPAGLHGAPALRSESESPVETVKPEPTVETAVYPEGAKGEAEAGDPSAADLDAVAEEQQFVTRTRGKKVSQEPDGDE
jgi:hypothetical protein